MTQTTLAMAFHCHQPIGNFGWVVREAFERAYQPFLERLERHPTVKIALHYSGCLLDWLEAEEPRFLERVVRLVQRGQVEMIGGGYYEPILPLIPEWDRQHQLQLLSDKVTALFGQRPCGAWLAERVWEPQVAQTLARAGFDYTIVDDTHIRAARGWSPELKGQQDVFGCYLTEDEGWSLRLFPSSKRLRYAIPFHPVQETIDFLRACPAGTLVTFADDGEKFGLWPGTHRWVYDEGWLEQWFQALEANAEWLATATLRDCATTRPPAGQVYLPCMSYEEMLEWSGGYFRNFLVKYPEANLMHKRMLDISQRLHAVEQRRGSRKVQAASVTVNGRRLSRRRVLELARHELHQAQCNCGYWHGVFGGLYLQHLRQSVYSHLISAERWLDRVEPRAARRGAVVTGDLNGDGQAEVRLTTPQLQLIVAPAKGAAVIECDFRPAALNVGNTLMRQPEVYHATLLKAKGTLLSRLTGEGGNPKSIHELLGTKETGLASFLTYDRYPRWSVIEHWLTERPTLEQVQRNALVEVADPLGGYHCKCLPARAAARARTAGPALEGERLLGIQTAVGQHVLRCKKRLALHPHAPRWTYALQCSHVEHAPWSGWVGVEWNLSLRDQRYLEPREESAVQSLTLEDRDQGVRVTFEMSAPLELFTFPVETVSGSEEGLERTYQGLCLWWGSLIRCAPDTSWTLMVEQCLESLT